MRKLQRTDDTKYPQKNMITSRLILNKAASKARFVTNVWILEEQT